MDEIDDVDCVLNCKKENVLSFDICDIELEFVNFEEFKIGNKDVDWIYLDNIINDLEMSFVDKEIMDCGDENYIFSEVECLEDLIDIFGNFLER